MLYALKGGKKWVAKKGTHMVKIGEGIKCPICHGNARVVWISEDSKTTLNSKTFFWKFSLNWL